MSIQGSSEKARDIQKANDFAAKFAKLDTDGDDIFSFNEMKIANADDDFYRRMEETFNRKKLGESCFRERWMREMRKTDDFSKNNFGWEYNELAGFSYKDNDHMTVWQRLNAKCVPATESEKEQWRELIRTEAAKLYTEFLDNNHDGVVDKEDVRRSGILNR